MAAAIECMIYRVNETLDKLLTCDFRLNTSVNRAISNIMIS